MDMECLLAVPPGSFEHDLQPLPSPFCALLPIQEEWQLWCLHSPVAGLDWGSCFGSRMFILLSL